jgi:hypothetical protein
MTSVLRSMSFSRRFRRRAPSGRRIQPLLLTSQAPCRSDVVGGINRVRLILQTLEVTRGHDGFLRGKPEPALLVAAYRTDGGHPASLVGRVLLRAQVKSSMPCSVELGAREIRYEARFAPTERLLVLVLSVEENSGDGVAALYASFEKPAQLLIYNAGESVPSPLSLEEWAKRECRAPAAHAIEVLRDGQSLDKIADSDQFIAASAFSIGAGARSNEDWRMPFVARDERNDWTLLARMRID